MYLASTYSYVHIYLGTLSTTKKTIPDTSTVFNNTGFLDTSNANSQHETSFKDDCKLQCHWLKSHHKNNKLIYYIIM